MKTVSIILFAVLTGCVYVARAQQPANSAPMVQSTPGAPLRQTTRVVADVAIPNLPGKRLVSRVIDYPPGGGTPSHRHARSAFIYAYVLAGEIRSQVDDGPPHVYKAGETWFENPGAHHRVSVNASNTEPARLLAVIVVDVSDDQLTIPDSPERTARRQPQDAHRSSARSKNAESVTNSQTKGNKYVQR
ncbi:MAG TPA: cupin domain-containing protein [Pyrinomonadaceae bacterium]|nr:cupin domain-containing protein [Pyrinomonadaceae bacterium]